MPQGQVLLRSLRTLATRRRSLKVMEGRLNREERQVMGAVSRSLSRWGYRVVAVSERDEPRSARPRRPRRRLERKNLKCPKCGRRFGFAMHLARHVRAVHGTKKRAA